MCPSAAITGSSSVMWVIGHSICSRSCRALSGVPEKRCSGNAAPFAGGRNSLIHLSLPPGIAAGSSSVCIAYVSSYPLLQRNTMLGKAGIACDMYSLATCLRLCLQRSIRQEACATHTFR